MLLAPLKNNPQRKANSTVKWLSGPTNGWNAKDDLTDMDPLDAIGLDNVVVLETGIKTRAGYASHVTGLGSAVLSLMEYSGPDGTTELYGATATDIYEVTTAGAVGAAVVSSLTSGIWSHTMFATAGGNFLVACNGADAVQNYDGSTWTTPTITGSGLTSTNLVQVTAHMTRLWFVEKNTLKVWYLGASAISGTATAIDFGPISKFGGHLVAMASWSRDGGAGMDDLAVFVTSRGEVHVYQGSDPSSSTTWERVGTFKVGEPIGRKCFVKAGADLGLLTSQGLVPLSNILSLASTEVPRVAATEQIGSAFKAAYGGGKSMRGWQVLEYPKQSLVIVNVPHVEGVTYYQYVFSTPQMAWSRFTGINAECWSLMGDRLFFGGIDGTVYEYTGDDDNGAEIHSVIVQAFTDLKAVGNKTFKRIKPQLIAPVGYRPQVGFRFDYGNTEVLFSSTGYDQPGPTWDTTAWDVEYWASEATPTAEWQAVRGRGFVVALVIRMSATESVTYNGSRILYELGTPI